MQEEYNIVLEKIAVRLRGPISTLGPLFASISLLLALILDLAGASPLLGLALLYPALLGGFLEFYFLLHLIRARSILAGPIAGGFRLIIRAAWSVPFYYTILGIPLVAWQVKTNTEHILGVGINEIKCKYYYNILLFILTFGFLLLLFQRCVALAIAQELDRVLSKPPEGFSSKGYEREEYSRGSNTSI